MQGSCYLHDELTSRRSLVIAGTKTSVSLPTNLELNGPSDSSILCISDTNDFNDDSQGGMLAPLQIVVL